MVGITEDSSMMACLSHYTTVLIISICLKVLINFLKRSSFVSRSGCESNNGVI